MLMRFSLLASVGLVVLAPNPEARPERVDWRLLLPDDEGVWARLGLPFETGRAFGVSGS